MVLIGNRIKELRKKYRYTQTELAEKIGVTKSTIAAYENNSRQPSYEVLIKLSHTFNVSIDSILLNRPDTSINISDLTQDQIEIISTLISHFRNYES